VSAETFLPGEDAREIPVMRRSEEGWELLGSRCPRCGEHRYPARVLCPHDLSECDVVALSPVGVVYAAAQVHLGPVGFPAPYWVGWIDLPEEVRVYTILDVPDGTEAVPGDRAELAPRVVRTEPHEVVGPVFRTGR
jgi:uncharacterized OB-fold protein